MTYNEDSYLKSLKKDLEESLTSDIKITYSTEQEGDVKVLRLRSKQKINTSNIESMLKEIDFERLLCIHIGTYEYKVGKNKEVGVEIVMKNWIENYNVEKAIRLETIDPVKFDIELRKDIIKMMKKITKESLSSNYITGYLNGILDTYESISKENFHFTLHKYKKEKIKEQASDNGKKAIDAVLKPMREEESVGKKEGFKERLKSLLPFS